jgi:hypothetical protein
MMSLRKQIEPGQRLDRVSTRNQLLQISRKCRRVTRNVTDARRLQVKYSLDYYGFSARTRRIQQDEID